MKFGEHLRSSVIKEYQWYYLDYDGLKADLKAPTGPSSSGPSTSSPAKPEWSGEDEQRFLARLEAELDKIYTKEKVKSMEIQRRIAVSEREVREVADRMNEPGAGQDGPSDEEFMLLECDLSDIIADVHDLAKFVQLNYTGFYKIIKKHDKMTGWSLKPVFHERLQEKPFWKENYDGDVIKLSKLYDLVRTKGNPVRGDSAAGGKQANFVRQTTKYWVHPDNVMELKLIILKHLPVLVFNENKEFESDDSAITSIYYDNPNTWELYEGRLKKTEGAEAIRLRWYGGMQSDTIFIERKTHREDWTGESSVKARFNVKEKNVNPFMRGELLPEVLFQKARAERKKPEKAIAADERLAREIQWSVLKHGYRPVCRSFYHRTAFQLPADARVRISLDTELTMIREDNFDRIRSGDNWRRTDIGIDHPFSQLPPDDIVRFPYAVLEVKLQTQHGQHPPEWVRQLISSHLVEAVPKFSKFIHGTASLFPERIKLLPFWMPQMDADIRKPAKRNFGISRPSLSATTSTTGTEDEYESDEDVALNGRFSNPLTGVTSREATLQHRKRIVLPRDVEDQTEERPGEDDDYPVYDSEDEYDEDDALEEARRIGGLIYYSTLASNGIRSVGRGLVSAVRLCIPSRFIGSEVPRSDRLQMLFGEAPIQTKRVVAPKGKKISVPVRVEPKVYFAAERTFLDWLQFSILVSTISVTVLNFGQRPTVLSFAVGGIFTFLSIVCLAYSVAIYLYRSDAIRKRKAVRYHDRWGPTVLCAALFVGIVINIAFEGREREFW